MFLFMHVWCVILIKVWVWVHCLLHVWMTASLHHRIRISHSLVRLRSSSINEVAVRRARLVVGWVTVTGSTREQYAAVSLTKRPGGGLGRANRLLGETSLWKNVLVAKCPGAKCYGVKCQGAKCPGAKWLGAKTPGNESSRKRNVQGSNTSRGRLSRTGGANRRGGESSRGQNVPGVKCPGGKMSKGRNVQSPSKIWPVTVLICVCESNEVRSAGP